MKSLEWIIDIDPSEITASVAAEKMRHPELGKRELAERAFSRAQWKATAAGISTGLPGNPWIALPAATLDIAVTLKTEAIAAARTAVIYDERFFADEDARWELLIPVLGIGAGSQALRELGVRGSVGLTRATLRKYLSKEALKTLQKVMLKYFGIKVTQKSLLTKTLPIVGGMVGGLWNYVEVGVIRKRTIAYFEGTEASSG